MIIINDTGNIKDIIYGNASYEDVRKKITISQLLDLQDMMSKIQSSDGNTDPDYLYEKLRDKKKVKIVSFPSKNIYKIIVYNHAGHHSIAEEEIFKTSRETDANYWSTIAGVAKRLGYKHEDYVSDKDLQLFYDTVRREIIEELDKL